MLACLGMCAAPGRAHESGADCDARGGGFEASMSRERRGGETSGFRRSIVYVFFKERFSPDDDDESLI